jgi:hypothetical protein
MTRRPKQWRSNTCSCGSGKPKSAQYDARGIFLTYTCEDCHDRKMAEFRPDVLTDPAYWTDELTVWTSTSVSLYKTAHSNTGTQCALIR